MEGLIKQIRVRFSGQENKVEQSSNKKTSPTKTTSFKAEKKKFQNWIQRQFSRQMSQNSDTDDTELATAVAAAAYAVLLLKQSSIPEHEKISDDTKPSLARTKSRKEDTAVSFREFSRVSKPTSDESSKKIPKIADSKVSDTAISDEETAEKHVGLEPSIKKSPTSTDKPRSPVPSLEKVPTITDKPRGRIPSFRKAPSFADKPAPSIEKTATFPGKLTPSTEKTPNFTDKPAPSISKSPISTDKPAIQMQKIPTLTEQELNRTNSINPEGPASKLPSPRPDVGSTSKTPTPSTKPLPGKGGSKADEWEQAELAKVKKRYEEANERISSWENKRKVKARRKMDNTEGELAIRRAKAAEKYQREMQRIQQIVGAANAKALERQRYEEAKVKQKANVIRETGKIPASCLCC